MPKHTSNTLSMVLIFAFVIFLVAFLAFWTIGDYRFMASFFMAGVIALLSAIVFYLTFGYSGRPLGSHDHAGVGKGSGALKGSAAAGAAAAAVGGAAAVAGSSAGGTGADADADAAARAAAEREAEAARRKAADQEAAAKKAAEEAEAAKKRAADEADAKRAADAAEAKRAEQEADAKRAAEEAEANRARQEAEAKRAADEAEAKRAAEQAEAKRAAEQAEAKRAADEAEAERKRAAEAERQRAAQEEEAKAAAEREAAEAARKAEAAAAAEREAAEAARRAEAEAEAKAAEERAAREAEAEAEAARRAAAAQSGAGAGAGATAGAMGAGAGDRGNEGVRPSNVLSSARGGRGDDLKMINGVGPKLEGTLNGMGVYHFDQIAEWGDDELAWVDGNLEGFYGRASRDEWVPQARILADRGTLDGTQWAYADGSGKGDSGDGANDQASSQSQGQSVQTDIPDYDKDGVLEGTNEGSRPSGIDGPRGGQPDDLKQIKGVGPKLEKIVNELGFWHFDQVAAWSADEVAWVDANLKGFPGRVSRDKWVDQARILASGGETEFSKRVEDGDVY